MGTPRTSAVSTLASGPGVASYTQMYPEWVLVHASTFTANASATLRNPRAYSNEANAADIHPLIITQGAYVRFVGRWPIDAFTLGTPTMRIFGADKEPSAAGVYPSGTIFWRLDAATFNAAGSTFTAIVGTNAQTDGVNYYYSEVLTHNGMNLHGAKSVLPIVETASSDQFELFAQIVNI